MSLSEFEQIRKSIGNKSASAKSHPRPGLQEIAALPYFSAASNVIETEPADSTLAELLLSRYPGIRYTGVFREAVPSHASERISLLGRNAKLVRGGAEGELPLEAKSLDTLLTCYALEGMRMNHLYMACSEARRALKEGGHWLILARDPGRTAWERLRSFLQEKLGRPSLNVTHYISPEDWHTVEDSFLPGVNRLLILRRLSDPAPMPSA